MKRIRRGVILTVLAFLIALTVGSVAAQNDTAYNTQFTTSITYQNVGTGPADISIRFIKEDNTTYDVPRDQLPAGAGTSVFVGALNAVPADFRGSAVLNSSQPVVATLVQVPAGGIVRNRPLSNGFTGEQGANRFLVATTLKNRFSTNTIFSVQNVGTGPTNVTVNFFNADDPTAPPVPQTFDNLAANQAHYFDLGRIAELPDNFNGSAVVQASEGGSIVASAMELSTTGTSASSFEGVREGSTTVYMASALCNQFNAFSDYAVQNAGTGPTTVRVAYSNGTSETRVIEAGKKSSFGGCAGDESANSGFSGSATITSGVDGSTAQPLVAIGKIRGAGLSTAFVGVSGGVTQLALPYIRYGDDNTFFGGQNQRAFIAIQNVGADLPANSVQVQYIDKNGTVVGTHTIDQELRQGAKQNSSPANLGAAGNNFGIYPDGTYGGGARVIGPAGSQLVAIVRIVSRVPSISATASVGEDYNGIPVQQ